MWNVNFSGKSDFRNGTNGFISTMWNVNKEYVEKKQFDELVLSQLCGM